MHKLHQHKTNSIKKKNITERVAFEMIKLKKHYPGSHASHNATRQHHFLLSNRAPPSATEEVI